MPHPQLTRADGNTPPGIIARPIVAAGMWFALRELIDTSRFDVLLRRGPFTMVIRFTSTLTDDDEARLAPALLKALGNLLALFPISYSLRIETTSGDIIEDGRAAARPDAWLAPGSPVTRDGSERRKSFNPPR